MRKMLIQVLKRGWVLLALFLLTGLLHITFQGLTNSSLLPLPTRAQISPLDTPTQQPAPTHTPLPIVIHTPTFRPSPSITPTPLLLRAPARDAQGWLLFGRWPDRVGGIRTGPDAHPLDERSVFLRWPDGQPVRMAFSRLIPSPDGHLLAALEETEGGDVVYVFDAQTGRALFSGDSPISMGLFMGWHPDSFHILFRDDAAYQGLWWIHVLNGTRQLILSYPFFDFSGAAISPDGQRLAYGLNAPEAHQIWMAYPDGSAPRLVLESRYVVYVFGWSPDGRWLLYTGEPGAAEAGAPSARGKILWRMDREGRQRLPLQGPFVFGWGFWPVWSPDGRRVAYVGWGEGHDCWQKEESYRADPLCRWRGVEIYVEEVETGSLLPLASNAIDPVWSPDGRWLAYSAMDEHEQIDLWIAQFDGSGRRRLTYTSEAEKGLAWLPKP